MILNVGFGEYERTPAVFELIMTNQLQIFLIKCTQRLNQGHEPVNHKKQLHNVKLCKPSTAIVFDQTRTRTRLILTHINGEI